MKNNVLVDNEKKNNRLLISCNWFVVFLCYPLFYFNRFMNFTSVSYSGITICFIITLILALISELWYRIEAKKESLVPNLTYYIITAICFSITMVIALMGDAYLLAVYIYVFIAAALYYDSRLIIYTSIINSVSVIILLSTKLINPYFHFKIQIFYIDIFFTFSACLLLLIVYSKKSMRIIELIARQQKELSELNASLENKVKERTLQLITANDELNQKNQDMIKLNQIIIESNEVLQNAYEELSRTETQLIQNEKMASLGSLVAGIAHEINNPLGALNNNISIYDKLIKLLEEKLSDDPTSEKLINDFNHLNNVNMIACDRIIKIVKSLRTFARLDEAELNETDIHESIENTLIILTHKLKNNIEIVKEYGEIPKIICYSNQINQVFMNVLSNALDAIGDKGTIRIITQSIDDYAVIKIKDNGSGIKHENLKKIFNPGFTTKKVGVGTGLGLSIVYNIIETHHGTITFDSELDKGTEVTIKIPINPGLVNQRA